MNTNEKRFILQNILNSSKLKNKYDSYRIKYKLDKKSIINRILNEIEPLSKKFKDTIKLVMK
jgi:hypothetical protein